ncbi:MAG: response regulator [Magnetospirillum gryphiswaldense]|nr:response regulator [Magnetospirillum gryphiswaldense]
MLAPRSAFVAFLILFIPSALVTGIGGVVYGKAEIQLQIERRALAETSSVDVGNLAIRETLHAIASDIIYLANLPRLKAALDTPSAENMALLSDNLSIFMDSFAIYDQVRWIDFSGKERMRLNFDRKEGRSWVVPEGQLADKSNRYYFQNALSLAPRSIYLSPFDLNVENESIELPVKPTLRLATPAVDSSGRRKGVIVINYLGDKLLDTFSASSRRMHANLMLLDGDGFWLRSPNPEQEWGFMFNRQDDRFGVSNPKVWGLIQSQNLGQVQLDDGVWTWQRIYPVDEVKRAGRLNAAARVTPDISQKNDYVWTIVTHVPRSEIRQISFSVWKGLAFPFTLFGSILFLGCWTLALFHQRIRKLNTVLERRADAAEAAGNAKAAFLANMSHEIRTPMNAVLGLTYLLQQRALKPEEKDLVSKIGIAGRSLLAIINDILDFSKIEAGRLELEHTKFRLQDVLDNVGAIMAASACDKDIELVVGAAPADSNHLMGDPSRLQQILVNLTSNAIKFTESGEVSLQVQRMARDGGGACLRFSVCDTGIGIPQDKQSLIFSNFSQADMTTARRFGGTGLGLSISRHLVQMMGGEIGVTSQPGAGSEFWFTIPFQMAEQNGFAVPTMAYLNVLVVDDHTVARESLAEIVRGLGWQADCAGSGHQALRMYRERAEAGRPYDVVLMDWRMPDMDGIQTGKALRQIGEGGHSPIIIMVSAYAREDLLKHPDSAVADLILNKPVTASAAYNAIAEAKRIRSGGDVVASLGKQGARLVGMRVLVVDDSTINCEVARRILESEGASVTLANDGVHALSILMGDAENIDAVLMDVQMPVLDGYETTRRIRSELKLLRLPVIALTAGAFLSQQQAAIAAGMDDFIAKPFEVEQMINILQRLAGKTTPQPLPTPTPSPPPSQDAIPDVVLDLDKAMANWRDTEVLHRYLRYFSANYADAFNAITQHVKDGETDKAAALTHKIKGAAGNLALYRVHSAAARLDEAIHQNSQSLTLQIEALGSTLKEAFAHIGQLTQPTAQGNSTDFVTNLNSATSMLGELIEMLNLDSPDECEPILAALSSVMPSPMLEPIRVHVESFDFRGAEREARKLAENLGIKTGASDP